MNGFFDKENGLSFISYPSFSAPECDEALINSVKRKNKCDVFGKRINKLFISYIFMILFLLFAKEYPYFIPNVVYYPFSLFGTVGHDLFFLLKLEYVSAILRYVLIFFPLYLYYLSEKKVIKNLLKPKELKISRVPAAFVFVFGMIFILNIVISIVNQALYGSGNADSSLPTDAFGIVFTFVSTAIVPAFVEEFVFRHVILRSLLPYNKYFAVLCSSLMFGLAHFSMDQNLFAVFFGIMIGFIYVKTESVIPGIIFHMLNNAFSAFQSYAGDYFSDEAQKALTAFVIVSIYLALFIAVYYIFNPKASPFYINGKEFSDITLTQEDVSAKLLKSKALYVLFAVYLVVAAILLE